jgi:cbb3-type cytochrome oxidase subunit 1
MLTQRSPMSKRLRSSAIARWYIIAAAIYLCIGLAVGIGMGIAENFKYVVVHAHLNLLGWATMCLYGLVLQAFPELGASRLVRWQFAAANLGVVIFVPGLVLVVAGVTHVAAIVGSLISFVGALLFVGLLIGSLRQGRGETEQPGPSSTSTAAH